MCIDYTNLKKTCPKDSYPLSSTDCLVDGAVGHHVLSFLDAYSRYNQIQIHPRGKEKTTFMTDGDNFYYEVMPLTQLTRDWWITSSKGCSAEMLRFM